MKICTHAHLEICACVCVWGHVCEFVSVGAVSSYLLLFPHTPKNCTHSHIFNTHIPASNMHPHTPTAW